LLLSDKCSNDGESFLPLTSVLGVLESVSHFSENK